MEKKTSFPSLRRFNLFMGGLHLIQGGLMVYLFLTVEIFGLLMEKLNQGKEKASWLSFWYGTFAGLVPWVVVFLYAFGNSDLSRVPWFVYAIFGSYFVFFNLFPST